MQLTVESKCGGKRLKGIPVEMSAPPLVSIVTVVFNGAAELESTILSVLGQTCSNLEYIIIDGGSTDGTLDVIGKYDDIIGYWVSEKDKGIYDAMNKGLEAACGKWIYYLNCGDSFSYSDVVEKASGALADTKAPIVAGFVLVNSTDSNISRLPLPAVADTSARSLFKRRFCHQALFVLREAYLAHHGFDLNFPTFADFDVCWKIISTCGEPEYIDLDIANFDLTGVSSDSRKSLTLYIEAERIFHKHDEGRSRVGYWIGFARSFAYRYKRALVGRFR